LTYELVIGLEDRGSGQPLDTPVRIGSVTPSIASINPLPDEFSVPNAADTTVGELFTLRGYSLGPRFLQPGGSTHVTLHWQAQAKPNADYVLGLWLVDPSGEQIPLVDREPLDGDYCTSHWDAGQWVRDRFDLLLPPDLPGGIYRVEAGWYDDSGTWLMTAEGLGMPLGEILVANQ
jgi:hypothetical protein